jgi:hypothetical protein
MIPQQIQTRCSNCQVERELEYYDEWRIDGKTLYMYNCSVCNGTKSFIEDDLEKLAKKKEIKNARN